MAKSQLPDLGYCNQLLEGQSRSECNQRNLHHYIYISWLNIEKIHLLQDAKKARGLTHVILVEQIWSSNLHGRQRCKSLCNKIYKKKREKKKAQNL